MLHDKNNSGQSLQIQKTLSRKRPKERKSHGPRLRSAHPFPTMYSSIATVTRGMTASHIQHEAKAGASSTTYHGGTAHEPPPGWLVGFSHGKKRLLKIMVTSRQESVRCGLHSLGTASTIPARQRAILARITNPLPPMPHNDAKAVAHCNLRRGGWVASLLPWSASPFRRKEVVWLRGITRDMPWKLSLGQEQAQRTQRQAAGSPKATTHSL